MTIRTQLGASVLRVSGAPMSIAFGEHWKNPGLVHTSLPGIPNSGNTLGAREFHLMNQTARDLLVAGTRIPDFIVPNKLSKNLNVGFYLSSPATPNMNLIRQIISKDPSPLTDQFRQITVPAEETISVWAYFWAPNTGYDDDTAFTYLRAYEKTFNISFKYRTSDTTSDATNTWLTGPETTISGNTFKIITPRS